MRTFGLIGKTLTHSFSVQYFNEKFFKEGISKCQYLNFELAKISEFPELIKDYKLSGLNITIPYKESIIPYLDELSPAAKSIGAVNTIQIIKGKLIGHNTDYIGFLQSLKPIIEGRNKALILGDGGSAKAVRFALKQLNIAHKTVSRKTSFDYLDIDRQIIEFNDIIINTTPLGTFPKTDEYPRIPYEYLNSKHLLYDLTYNPPKSLFLQYGKAHKCTIKNGLEMLQKQAEASWNIWNL